MVDKDNEMFLTCHECGRISLVKRVRSTPINLDELTAAQRAVLEQHAGERRAFCAQCFDKLTTMEGWRRQPGFDAGMQRIAQSFDTPCTPEG